MTRDLDPRSARVAIGIPAVLALLSMIGPFSIDTPFPAFAEMGDALRVTSGELQLVVTAYMLAFASMSLFHGPLSDALGRKPVIIGSLVKLAKLRKIECIAEWVENQAAIDILRNLGVRYAQGFFLDMPSPLSDKRGAI